MNLVLRIFLIPIGYIAAIFAASSVAAIAEWLRAYGPVADDPAALGLTSFVVLSEWILLFFVLGYKAAIPGLAAIAVAEIFAIRSVLYFCAVGLATAFVVSLMIEPGGVPPFVAEPAIAAVSGLAGGLAYWVSSGRWSGLRPRTEPAAV